MLPVEIHCRNENVILRARNSEILILPAFTRVLRTLAEPKAFSDYFLQEALINRPARKLFEAWLRKDATLWPRLFQNIQLHIALPDATEAVSAASEVVVETEDSSAEGKKAAPKKARTASTTKSPVAKKPTAAASKMASKTTANSSTKKTGRKKV